MELDKVIYISLFLIVTISDAIRDAYVERLTSWFFWHFFKWLSFFLPLLYIIYLKKIDIVTITYLAFTCSILWNAVYKYFTWRQK